MNPFISQNFKLLELRYSTKVLWPLYYLIPKQPLDLAEIEDIKNPKGALNNYFKFYLI